ncbi:MAG: tetratricopeptide repeat protein [Dehalococcoidia bacterium]
MTRARIETPNLILLVSLLAVVFAYRPGLNGPFIFDDGGNILANEAIHLESLSFANLQEAMVSGGAGPILRPLAMLSFALNHYWTGLDPYFFKLTNLCIHLFNGVLVFAVCRRLVALTNRLQPARSAHPSWIACGVAGLWLAHPAHLTSVLYVVQRMTSLSGSFVLLGVWVYLKARDAMWDARYPWLMLWVGVPVCTLLATLVKENGVLLIPLLFVLEFTLLRFKVARAQRIGSLDQFYGLFLLVPAIATAVFLSTHHGWLTAPESGRGFTVLERLLTESRVLLLYLKILVLPTIGDLALYYDDYAVSKGLLDPLSTLFCLIVLGGATSLAVLRREIHPWFAFAVLWFLTAHALESSFILLELVHVHRNYIAYLGPMLAGGVWFSRLLDRRESRVPALICVVPVVLCLIVTWQRAGQWSNPIDLIGYEVRHRPQSARAHYDLGRLYYAAERSLQDKKYRTLAERHFWRSVELNPRGFGGLAALVQIGSKPGSTLESDTLNALYMRLRRHPVVAGDLSALRQLVNCNADGECQLSPAEMLEMFGAALSNRRLTARNKAEILVTMAPYYAERLGDMTVALDLLQEAVELVPDSASYRLILAGALAANKDTHRAREQVRIVESKNLLGRYNRELRAVKERLNALGNHDAG